MPFVTRRMRARLSFRSRYARYCGRNSAVHTASTSAHAVNHSGSDPSSMAPPIRKFFLSHYRSACKMVRTHGRIRHTPVVTA